MKRTLVALTAMLACLLADAQTDVKRLYNDDINPIEQIDGAVARAKAEGKFVVCQVGGNWCPWCLRFARFITSDSTIASVINDNFEYIHVSYNPRLSGSETQQQQAAALMKRLDNCGRFGFPVLVVLDEEGKVLHIQDSSFLEKENPGTAGSPEENAQELGYNRERVLRFFKSWTPQAVRK